MLITSDKIKSFNPCNDRWENFNANYPNFKGNLAEFLSLDLINYDDKLWVGVNLMTKNQQVKFAIACAESVLYIYEDKYPNDTRPRELLEYLKSIQDFGNMTEDQKSLLFKLKKSVYSASVNAYPDNNVADAAYATYAAYVTISDNPYGYAGYASDAAVNASNRIRKNQQELNLLFMKQVLETK